MQIKLLGTILETVDTGIEQDDQNSCPQELLSRCLKKKFIDVLSFEFNGRFLGPGKYLHIVYLKTTHLICTYLKIDPLKCIQIRNFVCKATHKMFSFGKESFCEVIIP